MEKRQKWLLAVLFTGVLMGALDISIVGPAIPSIDQALGITEKEKTWIFSIYILFNLIGIAPLARFSDVWGRKKVYAFSILLFGFGSLIAALANDINMLLVGRAIQGFGSSGIFPVASATVGDVFPAEKRGRILGFIGMVFGLAFIIGPVIAGFLLKYFEWNVLFLINIPLAIAVLFFSWRLLPSKQLLKLKELDWKGMLLFALLLASFTIGINLLDFTGHAPGAKSFMPSILLGVLMLVTLIVFMLVEKKAAMPVIKPSLFHKKQVRIVGLLAIGTGLFQATFVFIPDMTVLAFDVKVYIASFMMVPVVIATAIGSPISGRMIDKYGSRALIVAAFVLMTLGLFFLVLLKSQYVIYYAAGLFLGLGQSVLGGSSLRYIMLNEVGERDRALTQGVVTVFIAIGQLSGAAIFGLINSVFEGMKGYHFTFGLLAVFSGILLLISFRLKSRNEERASFDNNVS